MVGSDSPDSKISRASWKRIVDASSTGTVYLARPSKERESRTELLTIMIDGTPSGPVYTAFRKAAGTTEGRETVLRDGILGA